ncbi:hypothetical protein DMH04_28550 [Kibdelosporangium aridum]|uniref:Uncharacterized protein n=1 Tax=Kibdelosporangium aridum TaxID=2030 RepID=A0A428Z3T6_KIBAR|nr:hypothetical protein [Kibdelosporangium aridum]RSM80873.1 hypothetical protein DMH04_28550 [Kibdelosporangium aridum]
MTTGLTSNNTHSSLLRAQARYRVDELGTHVVIVPASCPSGRHLLATCGYRIIETGDVLNVICQQCTNTSQPADRWILATGGRQAQSAEFDDGPYTHTVRAHAASL